MIKFSKTLCIIVCMLSLFACGGDKDNKKVANPEGEPKDIVIDPQAPPKDVVLDPQAPPKDVVLDPQAPPKDVVLDPQAPPKDVVLDPQAPPKDVVIDPQAPPADVVIDPQAPPTDVVVDPQGPPTEVIEQQKTSISLSGAVNNLSTGLVVQSATVTVKIGATPSAPVTLVKGDFLIPNLPADADYELTIHSPTDEFMDRTVFGKTRAVTSPGVTNQDLGFITVAKGVERKFSIINSKTNLPISTLVLHANSTLGAGANPGQSLHTSTYDATAEQYKITLPEKMGLDVYASLDIDADGKPDFIPDNSVYGTGETLLISSTYINNPRAIYLSGLNLSGNVKIRISLLDATLKPILNARPTITDAVNGSLNATYDAVTGQYIFDAAISTDIQILIPAFWSGTATYGSSTVLIHKVAEADDLTYAVTTAQNSNVPVKFAEDEAKIFNIVQLPMTVADTFSVAMESSTLDAVTQEFKVAYSGPVAVAADSATLVKKRIHIVRGDESVSDSVAPGTTLIETVEEPLAVDIGLSLNNTLLTLTPKAALTSAGSYKYNIGLVTDAVSQTSRDLPKDSLEFDVESPAVFDISEVKLDNINFKTQSSLIHLTNSTGIPERFPHLDEFMTYLIFPRSLKNVKNLVLHKSSTTVDNVAKARNEDFFAVVDGKVKCRLFTTISMPWNEDLVGSAPDNMIRSAAVSDGSWYAIFVDEQMADNIPYANTMSFSYKLETWDGVQTVGILTLPVL